MVYNTLLTYNTAVFLPAIAVCITLVTGVGFRMQGDALQVFDGTGNLLAFLDRITFWTALKCFEGEKKALALASRLEEAAFENYRRLDNEEKQDFDVIAVSLKKEFLGGAMDRRLSVEEMRGRK